jgi:hypothetical protein
MYHLLELRQGNQRRSHHCVHNTLDACLQSYGCTKITPMRYSARYGQHMGSVLVLLHHVDSAHLVAAARFTAG